MTTNPNILAANLAHLRRFGASLADRIAAATPAPLAWSASRSGPLTAMIEHEGKQLTLASKFDPMAEADKILGVVDYQKHAGVVILGMGLGYHVARAAQEIGRDSLLIVFAPGVELLRAVLEKIDHTAWLSKPNVVLADDKMDRAELVRRIERFAGIITQGTVLVSHPPTRQLSAAAVQNFSQMMTEAMAFCRTSVATSLVNSSRTISNLTANLAYYAAGPNTNELHNAARGFPAVCVGAGPSLAKNIHLLSDPIVRKNVVVISAQTTLKPLLDRGIKPDFVTALDYHEISRRFYEGLPELPGVTLVAEAKAHPSITDNYPGPIRVVQNGFLDRMLSEVALPIVPIKGGATVAHLSFYLAQHLGCDPIILIGQDLGFSSGLYYCPGTAIHEVWAPELNQFNTLEMMEWQRIVRHRNHLSEVKDIHGRPAYSDEQMLTYLKQFERDFATAPQKILDATEGGLAKEHTTRTMLSDALMEYAIKPVPAMAMPKRELSGDRLDAVRKLIERRLDEIAEFRRITKKTVPILQQMGEHQRDRIRMDKLFADLERNKNKVDKMPQIFSLIAELNTVGTFRRARADRALEGSDSEDFDVQNKRIERDLENLDWLVQSCDEATKIFNEALRRVREKSKGQQHKPRAAQAAPSIP